MKTKAKTYKFSTADVVSYINDHVEMVNNISEIVRKKSKSIDQKSIDKLAIVNNAVKNIRELIVYTKKNFSIDEKTFEESKSNILRITEFIDSIITNVLRKIFLLSNLSIITFPAVWLCKMQISRIVSLIKYTYKKLSLIMMLKVSLLSGAFENITSIVNNIIYITKELTKMGMIAWVAIPALHKSITYIRILKLFMIAVFNAFAIRQTLRIRVLQTYFEILNVVSDSILSITSKLIKLGIITTFTAWAIKAASKFIIKLAIFNKLILLLFRKRDVISLKILSIHFNALDNITEILISSSKNLIKLGIVSLFVRPLFKTIRIYLIMLHRLISMLKTTFNIKLFKLIKIKLKIRVLKGIFNQLILLAIKSILLATVSLVAIPALLLDIVFVLTLTLFIKVLQIMLRIAKIKFKDILSLILIITVLGLLILIAIEIKKLNDIGSKIKWVNLFMVLGGILLVAVFSILIGLAAMAIIPIIGIAAIGLVALIIVVGLLVLIAFALEYLQSIELNQDAIIRNVMAILDCAEKIKELLFKSKENKEPQTDSSSQESKDALKDMGVADPGIIEVLAKFGSLFTTLLSIALISFIAGKLNDLQQLTLNRDAIMTNVGVVLDVSKNITNVLFDKPTNTGEGEGSEDNKSMIESLINFIGGPFKMLSGLLEAIVAIPILLTTILSVGMIYVIAKMLTKIVEIELDGVAIRKKINDIVFTAQSISDMVFGNYEEETPKQPSTEEKSKWTQFIDGAKEVGGKVWNATGGALLDAAGNLISGGVLGSLMPSLMSLNVVVDLIKGVQELEFDSTSTTNKINEIIRITKTISSSVSSGTGSIASIDEDKVEIFEDYVDSSIKYFKNINKLDVDKIKSIGDMYDKMGQFMEKLNNAPINDIADALVNKISPALSSIDESIGGNKNNKKSNNSTTVTTQATDQSTQTSKQIDYTGMLENIEDLLEQIKKKLNSQPQPAF